MKKRYDIGGIPSQLQNGDSLMTTTPDAANLEDDGKHSLTDVIQDTDTDAQAVVNDDAAVSEDDAVNADDDTVSADAEDDAVNADADATVNDSDATDDDASFTPGSWPSPAPAPFQGTTNLDLLKRWAAENKVEADPYVGGLLSASASRQDLSMWASLDPVEMLPHPTVKSGQRLSRFARTLIFVRNVAVFVPVALTWFAIRQASQAFGAFATAKEGQLAPGGQLDLNFLRFWGSGGDTKLGFEWLSAEWRIQNIALLDAIIITAIVLATMLAGVLENRASRKLAHAEQVAETSRLYVAIDIKRALHGNRQATPESIAESLAESLTDLLGATRMMANSSARLEAASIGVDAMGPRFDQFNRRLEILDQHLGGNVVKAVTDLVSSVSALGKTVDSDFTRVLNEVLVGLEEVQQQLSRTSSSVEFGTKQLRDDLDAIVGRLGSVTQRGRV